MVLCGEPERRNRRQTFCREPLSQSDRRKGLVDREGGAGKQSDLLTGNNDKRTLIAQLSNIFEGAFTAAEFPVLPDENLCKLVSILTGNPAELLSERLVGLKIKRGAAVELSYAVEMIKVINEEGAGPGDLSVTNTGTIHRKSALNTS